tara:strand:- start:38404 stop:39891 length:1488 start_codon:yes stop_codon:yes gene_type:complete
MVFVGAVLSCKSPQKENSGIFGSDSISFSRIIDISKLGRPFPNLTGYRNTSLQKASAPVLGEFSSGILGKASITRFWLNLDEMWDYRTEEYVFDFRIGNDKYKDVKEKWRETWDSEEATNVTYYQYLNGYSSYSDEIMLTIRRYERDVLDGKLPISKKKWKDVFKTGLKHYKQKFPNIRYVEVGNEYALKGFMNGTPEEYYTFYQLGYQAVNEINDELNLSDDEKILVGGPVVTGDILKKIDLFLNLYKNDPSSNKRVDFLSWHEYDKKNHQTANRQNEIIDLMVKYGLSTELPLFITEHNPFHLKEDKYEYHMMNAAHLPRSLYYTDLNSPNIKIFPWVQYHNEKIQTKFMWFRGPNEPTTKAEEIQILPLGRSMQFLSMHEEKEVEVKNDIEGDDLVLASVHKNSVVVEAINYEGVRKGEIRLVGIDKEYKKANVKSYLIDNENNNCLTNPECSNSLQLHANETYELIDSRIHLEIDELSQNGIVLWQIELLK